MTGAASAAGQAGALLEVQDLNVRFDTADGVLHAVRGTSFEVRTGETLGIVGESGSGKSVTAQALLGLVPGADVTGHAWFEGHDLLAMNDTQLREIRGQRISMVFQDPLTSLHPLYRLGWQLTEADARARHGQPRGGQPPGRRAARHGRHPPARRAPGRLPAPVLRRDAPARDDRDGAGPATRR